MARRRIKHIRVGRCSVSIYRDSDAGEFVVRQTVGGKITGGRADGGYFTDDKSDARSTAAHMIRKLRKRPACRGVA